MKHLIALSALALLALSIAYAQSLGTVILTHRDALGRTQTATAALDHFSFDGSGTPTLYVWMYSDQLFCSAFGGN